MLTLIIKNKKGVYARYTPQKKTMYNQKKSPQDINENLRLTAFCFKKYCISDVCVCVCGFIRCRIDVTVSHPVPADFLDRLMDFQLSVDPPRAVSNLNQ